MTRTTYHPDFVAYQHFIAEHPTYSNMPDAYNSQGEVRWVAPKPTPLGQKRLAWWTAKAKEIGIDRTGAWISQVARTIHPTGKKPCQVCGTMMSIQYIYPGLNGRLGPGAMSNAPDRFDGFHSYNRCCRGTADKGRSKENMARYGEDRRAYEFWSDGDWKAASWLMKLFNKHGVSPDHVGPLSLGFCHRPQFRALTRAQNSARNNRMTLEDFTILKNEEASGETVASWHTDAVWNILKERVKDNADALIATKVLRTNMHLVLSTLSQIKQAGGGDYLKHFLHPEYAMYSIEFVGFNPQTGDYREMRKTTGSRTEYVRNANRYVRKSLESLDEYSDKSNRRVYASSAPETVVSSVLKLANKEHLESADRALKQFLEETARQLVKEAFAER